MFAIIDLETTGGSAKREKITEVAVYIHDGTRVVDEFVSLVNPEKSIPPHITRLTGIDNDMVAQAPKFYEIAKQLVEITEDMIFVAHNAGFDYSFMREEFRSLGYDYKRKKMCTVRLSRELLPGMPSYSLGNLCRDLNIEINGRHRAAGDAFATTKLFDVLLATQRGPDLIMEGNRNVLSDLHPKLDLDLVNNLPDTAGVYYFYNEAGELIYIGKSKNIRTRVLSHLRNMETRKGMNMRQQIVHVDCEVTGSELVALLKESGEIKQFRPVFNSAQKRSATTHSIVGSYDPFGYVQLSVEKTGKSQLPLMVFSSNQEAKEELYRITEKYQLCQKLNGLYKADRMCFHYTVRKCNGACIQEESHERYNGRAQDAMNSLKFHSQSFLVIDKGPNDENKSVVLVENGRYKGFGVVDTDVPVSDAEQLKEAIQPMAHNRDVQHIIRSYLRHHGVEKIIELE